MPESGQGDEVLSTKDRLEIQELTTRYGVLHDRRDYSRLSNCFTSDATYVLRAAGGQTFGPRVGRDAIVDQIRQFKASQSDIRRHHISNVLIDARAADMAIVDAYVLVSVILGDGLTVKTVGEYHDTVVRTPDGWRIAAKELLLDAAF